MIRSMPSPSDSRSTRWYTEEDQKYPQKTKGGKLKERYLQSQRSFLIEHTSLLIHQTNRKPFALQGPTSSHTSHLHLLMRKTCQGKEYQKSAQRSKTRLSPFHPIPKMKVPRARSLSSPLMKMRLSSFHCPPASKIENTVTINCEFSLLRLKYCLRVGAIPT